MKKQNKESKESKESKEIRIYKILHAFTSNFLFIVAIFTLLSIIMYILSALIHGVTPSYWGLGIGICLAGLYSLIRDLYKILKHPLPSTLSARLSTTIKGDF